MDPMVLRFECMKLALSNMANEPVTFDQMLDMSDALVAYVMEGVRPNAPPQT